MASPCKVIYLPLQNLYVFIFKIKNLLFEFLEYFLIILSNTTNSPIIYCKYIQYGVTATVSSHDSTALSRDDVPDPNPPVPAAGDTAQVRELYA